MNYITITDEILDLLRPIIDEMKSERSDLWSDNDNDDNGE